jgi:hypothetical protein
MTISRWVVLAVLGGLAYASAGVAQGTEDVTISNSVGQSASPVQAGVANLVTVGPEGASFDFGEVVNRTGSAVTWVIANMGDASSGTLAVISSDPVNFAPNPTSCASIPPGGSCNVSVTFNPQVTLAPGERVEFQAVLSVPGLSYAFAGTGRPPFSAEDP